MTVDPDLLERLRRSGIRIDREGRLIHEGEEIAHVGLRQALWRWLDRLPPPESRYVLRLDERRYAYVEVDDTPLVARSARLDGEGASERVLLGLSDGSEEALDPATLTVDDAGVLRCWVRGGKLEARLATSAAATVSELVVDEGGGGNGEGRLVLALAGRKQPIGPRRSVSD
jgi:hypothetical protein